MSQLHKSLGTNLRRIRTERGLTQEELGARAGIDSGSIALIESGQYSATVTMVERLAAVIDVPAAALLMAPRDRDDRHQHRSARAIDAGIGRRIRYLREKRRMTQQMLAFEIGRPLREVEDYEKGVRPVEPVLFILLATVLDARVSAFFIEEDPAGSAAPPSPSAIER